MSAWRLAAVAAFLAHPFAAGAGQPVTATPATLADVLAHVTAGTTIKLAPGDYAPVMLKEHRWSPPVVVEAGDAVLVGLRLTKVSGLTWHGGRFDGGEVERSGFNVTDADHLVIDGVRFVRFTRNGIGLGRVSDARVTNNVFTDMGSDGIDIAMSRRVVVDHNRCVDFHPTVGAHPDCVQLWSRPTDAPTADIVISNNEATGDMQGFTAFNHVRPDASGIPVNDGGFDRITIENNIAKVSSYHGVTLAECRDCIVRHNRAQSLPNPAFPRARAWIKVIGGANVVNCDNLAESFPRDPGRGRCPADK